MGDALLSRTHLVLPGWHPAAARHRLPVPPLQSHS